MARSTVHRATVGRPLRRSSAVILRRPYRLSGAAFTRPSGPVVVHTARIASITTASLWVRAAITRVGLFHAR